MVARSPHETPLGSVRLRAASFGLTREQRVPLSLGHVAEVARGETGRPRNPRPRRHPDGRQVSMLQSSQTVHSMDIAYRYSRGVGASQGVGGGAGTVARALRLGLDLLLGSLSDCCLVLFLCNSRNRILLGMSCVLCTQKALGRPVGPLSTT
jgi:hypothetical protein